MKTRDEDISNGAVLCASVEALRSGVVGTVSSGAIRKYFYRSSGRRVSGEALVLQLTESGPIATAADTGEQGTWWSADTAAVLPNLVSGAARALAYGRGQLGATHNRRRQDGPPEPPGNPSPLFSKPVPARIDLRAAERSVDLAMPGDDPSVRTDLIFDRVFAAQDIRRGKLAAKNRQLPVPLVTASIESRPFMPRLHNAISFRAERVDPTPFLSAFTLRRISNAGNRTRCGDGVLEVIRGDQGVSPGCITCEKQFVCCAAAKVSQQQQPLRPRLWRKTDKRFFDSPTTISVNNPPPRRTGASRKDIDLVVAIKIAETDIEPLIAACTGEKSETPLFTENKKIGIASRHCKTRSRSAQLGADKTNYPSWISHLSRPDRVNVPSRISHHLPGSLVSMEQKGSQQAALHDRNDRIERGPFWADRQLHNASSRSLQQNKFPGLHIRSNDLRRAVPIDIAQQRILPVQGNRRTRPLLIRKGSIAARECNIENFRARMLGDEVGSAVAVEIGGFQCRRVNRLEGQRYADHRNPNRLRAPGVILCPDHSALGGKPQQNNPSDWDDAGSAEGTEWCVRFPAHLFQTFSRDRRFEQSTFRSGRAWKLAESVLIRSASSSAADHPISIAGYRRFRDIQYCSHGPVTYDVCRAPGEANFKRKGTTPVENKILIIEDDPAVAKALEEGCRSIGGLVEIVSTGEAGLARATSEKFSLLVSDVGLPGISGFELCRRVREFNKDVSILMVTSHADEADRVLGLELGADDYVIKPFSIREVTARMRVLLRRYERIADSVSAAPQKKDESELTFGALQINKRRRLVTISGQALELTVLEYEVLEYLADRAGTPISRETLMRGVWGYDCSQFDSTVTTLLSRLRNKVEPVPEKPRFLITVKGVGYRFATPEELLD